MKQSLGRRHGHDGGRLAAATGLPEDHHAIRVSAEVLDVVAHPLERRPEILNTYIRRFRPLLAAQIREMQESEDVEPMIDGHDDDVFFLREIRPVVEQVIARADGETTAVHPHHDGTCLVVEPGREHVDAQAVLALRGVAIERGDDRCGLLSTRRDGRRVRDLEVILDA